MIISPQARSQARHLLDFIDDSPSPWHAVASAAGLLSANGFAELRETERWQLEAGGRYYVIRGGSSIIAFVLGQQELPDSGLRIVGAHTDSPGLRLKPRTAHASDGVIRLGVEVYGSPILATFTDRDLSLAGLVNVRTIDGFETRLLRFERPLVRLPNLAIHMNREVNEQGLKLHKQNELPLLLALERQGKDAENQFIGLVAEALDVEPHAILNMDLNVYDTQTGAFWGAEQEFLASGRLDNLASCHAALAALLETERQAATVMTALFDHEEVGSGSTVGAGGSFIADVLGRIGASQELDAQDRQRTAARSLLISADMAHAWHPNFAAAYEPQHHVMVNAGPVIKINANQRYATRADTAARFIELCEQAGVPFQQYAHRTDLGCGSTIGPVMSADLGMPTVDVGSPMWAMHSARESAGVLDHGYLVAALEAAFDGSSA